MNPVGVVVVAAAAAAAAVLDVAVAAVGLPVTASEAAPVAVHTC